MLRDPDESIRRRAAKALAVVGPDPAVVLAPLRAAVLDRLRTLLEDPSGWVREAAERALFRISYGAASPSEPGRR